MPTPLRTVGQILLAGTAAFAITAVGQGLWGVMVMANVKLTPALPWAALVMPLVLLALVLFLTGRGWPKMGAAARRALVPSAPIPARAWFWSLTAGGVGVLGLAALWTVMASLVRVPPNALPDIHGIPALTLGAILLVSIIAAPVTEEIAFRGYAMSLLRRDFSPIAALAISSVLFAAAHLTQGLSAPKLLIYLLVGLGLGLIALRTRSLLPAMVAHAFGDLIFFTQVWPHDAGRRLISQGGADHWFFANIAILVVSTPLCILAFRQLIRLTASPPRAHSRTWTAAAPVAA
ncbi:MAG TPA: CPBP family intramembrane glutamic endopeptidase [Caulobacteraceae bacterium]